MNTLNRASQMFVKLLVFNGSLLFAMSLMRLVLFLLVVRYWTFGADGFTLAGVFINGVRFDLCVLGFINIPVLFIVWAISTDFMAETNNSLLLFVRKSLLWVYLGVASLAIHLLALLDLMYFATQGQRWTFWAWQKSGFEFFAQVATKWGSPFTGGVIAFFLLLWVFRSLFILYRVKIHQVPLVIEKVNWGRGRFIVIGIVLPLLAVASAARGTWTAHHLGLEHSELSQIQALNQMTLSPLWAFDKKF